MKFYDVSQLAAVSRSCINDNTIFITIVKINFYYNKNSILKRIYDKYIKYSDFVYFFCKKMSTKNVVLSLIQLRLTVTNCETSQNFIYRYIVVKN